MSSTTCTFTEAMQFCSRILSRQNTPFIDPKDPLQCDVWLKFLNECFEGDQSRIDLLQECFGVLLTEKHHQPHITLLQGGGATGKSVVATVMKAVVGPTNYSAVPLRDLGNPFAAARLVGSLVNFDEGGDGNVSGPLVRAFACGELMRFTARRGAETVDRPTAKLVVIANDTPEVIRSSDALQRITRVVEFRRSVPAGEVNHDMTYPEWWLNQKGGSAHLFSWAFRGLMRLVGTMEGQSPAFRFTRVMETV